MSLALLDAYESDSSEEDKGATHNKNAEPVEITASVASKPQKLEPTKPTSSPTQCLTGSTSNRIGNASLEAQRKTPAIPPDLARELKAAGYDSSSINFVEVDPQPHANQPHQSSHIPQHALRNNTMRLARNITKGSVGTVARRKHQITALAAEAVALKVAQDALPGSTRSGSRMHRKR